MPFSNVAGVSSRVFLKLSACAFPLAEVALNVTDDGIKLFFCQHLISTGYLLNGKY